MGRVSSTEQLENNSLNRQREVVLKAATKLDVTIPDDCWWSGSISSKRGTNVNRKDLNEMIERCKKEKRIKYVIVDEPDRFMRSIDEAAYFEVTFRQLGVTVWYASEPELNNGDLAAKLLKFTKYLSAEGSNEERQRKSINGQTKALQEGRYTFNPKAGYMKGYESGVHQIHPVRGPALQKVLRDIASSRVTPTQGLINLNNSEFMHGHAQYKMDKFRRIATDVYYAGGIEISKQIKVRNLNGLHEPLITLEQHYELVRIFNGRKKNQAGPRKNGNPKYPLNNIVHCDNCKDKQYGRMVGIDLTNGKSPKVYEKYRCRACKRTVSREEMHLRTAQQFKKHPISDNGVKDLTKALKTVWKQREGDNQQEAIRLQHQLNRLRVTISQQVEAATSPDNAIIKDDILLNIARRKAEVADIEERIERLTDKADVDYEQFLRFAFEFTNNIGEAFLNTDMSRENRLRCKQIIFPADFRLDANGNVYTPEISPLIRLAGNKKDLPEPEKSLLVRVRRL